MSYSGRKRVGAGTCRVGPRSVGEVEELAAGVVPERHETRPEPLDHRAHPRQAAPRRHVRDRRRAERAQVAQHDVVERRPFRERAPEPRLGGRRRHLRRAPPEPARRHLDERQLAAARVRERGRIEVREPLRECGAELAPGERPFREELPRMVEDRPEVDSVEGRARTASAVRARRRAPAASAAGGVRQSPAETRWIVARITVVRTTARSDRSSESDSGRNRSRRDQSATYGSRGTWAWSPTRCSAASSGVSSERWSSSCRASVARPRARGPSVSGATRARAPPRAPGPPPGPRRGIRRGTCPRARGSRACLRRRSR